MSNADETYEVVRMADLRHSLLDIRDQLFKEQSLLLVNRGRPLAVIKPLANDSRVPREALVRNITYIRHHAREFYFRLNEGARIVLVYNGVKIGVVDPHLPAALRDRRF